MSINKETIEKSRDKKYSQFREDVFKALASKALKALEEKKVFVANNLANNALFEKSPTKKKTVSSGGKTKTKLSCPSGYKLVGRSCKKQSPEESKNRKKAAKKAAKKRKGSSSKTKAKRKRAMTKRKQRNL